MCTLKYKKYITEPGDHTDVILFSRMIKLSETPIYQAKFAQLMVDCDIVWLHISVHYTLRVAVVQCLYHITRKFQGYY